MNLEINITNSPVAYLDSLGKYSKLAVIEQSSKAGNKVRESVRSEFRNQTTEWSKEYKDGKFHAFKKKSKLGIRMSHGYRGKAGSIDNPASMESMITSFTNQTTGTTVIMGGHKAFKPMMINDGKITGYGQRVGAITRRTVGILEKLNSGETSASYKKGWSQGEIKGQFKGKQPYKKRNWAEKGFASAYGEVKSIMTDKLAQLIVNHEIQKGKTA